MPFSNIPLNDGNKIPAIAFGSGSANKGQDIHQFVEQALEAGFSHLDTAQFYQNEASVGRAIRESGLSREELYVTTKWSSGNLQDAISTSLTELGLKYVDLYLVHFPRIVGRNFETVWRHFESIKAQGLAKSIGVSNFAIQDLQNLLKVARIKPVVNQIHLHPYNYHENKALLEFHAKHGIVTEAYGSLAPLTTYPGGPLDTILQRIASTRGIAPSQVIFLWIRAKNAVIVTTSSKKEHLREYLAVGDLDELTEEEVAEIDAKGSHITTFRYQQNIVFMMVLTLVFLRLMLQTGTYSMGWEVSGIWKNLL